MTRTKTPARTVLFLSGLVPLITGAMLYAGPLDPPAGPIEPSGKTTQEVFDRVAAVEARTAINATNTPGDDDSTFKITEPGSYYLTANIIGEASKHGIEIASDNVTLDLNGFNMSGAAGVALSGIADTGGVVRSARILNGTVSGWSGSGIDLQNAVGVTVQRINATANAGFGIDVGVRSVIESCLAHSNGQSGFRLRQNTIVTRCSAVANGVHGFLQQIGGGDGTSGGSGARFEACEASLNAEDGINADNGAVIAGCRAGTNGSNGVNAGVGARISDSTATSNSAVGFLVGDASSVASCTAVSNATHGISAASQCRITGNRCTFNGAGPALGAGVFVQASAVQCLIESNHCSSNDHALWISGTNNIVVRNFGGASSFENYRAVAGNRLAPVVFANTAAAMSGNTGGAALGSTDPNANFSF
ncbi:right-handed parallel beta-helix repeat-containing protein [Synechococcus sp. Cruz CV-v-12]|uniref:right-handed parallel beta-helix repeat-containing protein n=1 Tax=Synechococcus sp. Cruz CV-v-12 TaxID=2823728 RepID=UPI0020CCA709|nr:right-handed parallel beta-helix repeat-containing protein [Synechococcus sp. Cruz CV-v-12]MCP9874371.1 right-handed parallel beta-helix repeat-containing protein [Synechococcus sp. Cruz CV-v-12]